VQCVWSGFAEFVSQRGHEAFPEVGPQGGPLAPRRVRDQGRVGRNPMLRVDSLHAYVLTGALACKLTCLHAYNSKDKLNPKTNVCFS